MMFLLIVTLSSMALAAIMSVIAWRLAAQERRRSEARIAALAAAIHEPAAVAASSSPRTALRRTDVAIRAEPPRLAAVPPSRPSQWSDDLPLRTAEASREGAELFASAHQTASTRRFALTAILIAAVAGALFLAGLMRSGETTSIPAAAVQAPSGDNRSAAPSQPGPLELVALGHQRDGERLVVRGVVRTPAGGAPFDQLTAVVFAFNADGGFVTSARAALDADGLRSAGEATFAVAVPDAVAASRYRVSFRSGDRIVPHVDRRDPIKRP